VFDVSYYYKLQSSTDYCFSILYFTLAFSDYLLSVLMKFVYLLLNTYYTVVDSLKPTEILVSFSSLCHWNETAVSVTKEETKTVSKLGVRDAKNERESRLGDVTSEISFAQDVQLNVPGNSCICYLVIMSRCFVNFVPQFLNVLILKCYV